MSAESITFRMHYRVRFYYQCPRDPSMDGWTPESQARVFASFPEAQAFGAAEVERGSAEAKEFALLRESIPSPAEYLVEPTHADLR